MSSGRDADIIANLRVIYRPILLTSNTPIDILRCHDLDGVGLPAMDANDTRRIADNQRGPPLQHEDAQGHSNPSDRKLAYGNRSRRHPHHPENDANNEINQ